MNKIVWTNFAISELKNIFLYYRMVANIETAKKIKNNIINAVKILSKNEEIGGMEQNLIELNQGHRFVVKGNYKIIYKVIGNTVYITDVFDCRQNPKKMLSNEINKTII